MEVMISDEFVNSVHDQPKACVPFAKSFKNVSDVDVKNRLTSHAQFWCDIEASRCVMRVIIAVY